MLNNPDINDLMYESAINKLAKLNNISILESKKLIASMSFIQYYNLLEAGSNIVPPSGQTIGPSAAQPAQQSPQNRQQNTQVNTRQQNTQMNATQPIQQNSWKGTGNPIQQGMTVGLNSQDGQPSSGQITQIDNSSGSVKVKDSTTGQENWYKNEDLQPGDQQASQVAEDLKRMKHLAGIKENCSSGTTGAGSVAVAPMAMGNIKKRQDIEEGPSDEYTPTTAKTVVGDTKPSQASGRLSANLAARGKKTASRKNNGIKSE